MTPPTASTSPGTSDRARARRRWGTGIAVGLAGLLVLAATLLVATRVTLSGESARRALVEQLQTVSGGPVTIDGDTSFTLLPRAGLSVERVTLVSGEARFSIDRIEADLDPWRALRGEAVLSRLVFIRPELRRDPAGPQGLPSLAETAPDADGPSRREALAGSLTSLSRLVLDRFGDLRRLELRDGVFRPEAGSARLGISNANLVFDRDSGDGAASASGSFVWNGQPAEIDLSLSDPAAFLRGETSRLDAALRSPPLDAEFRGDARQAGALSLDGRLRLSTPSLSRSLDWLEDPAFTLPDFGALSLSGQLALVGGEADLLDAAVTVAGSSGRGALEMSLGGQGPSLGGTLDFASFDLTPLAQAVAPLPTNALGLERPIDLAFLTGFGLDLRLSATEARLGKVPFTDVAATMKVKDGTAQFDIGDAGLFGGRGVGRLELAVAGTQQTMTGSLALSDVDAAQAFASLGVSSFSMAGRSSLTATFAAPAANWASIARYGTATARLGAREGVLHDLDLAALSRPGSRPLAEALEGSAATLPFSRLEATLSARGPDIALETMELQSEAGLLRAAGEISAATHAVSLAGRFERVLTTSDSAGEPFTGSKPVRVIMQGRWPNPTVTTEPDDGPR
ncbi:AsmA-like C-terminal region-containing protein [Aurantimonas sp. Leaf443]|uniref:AsmA family protein n=1 Tax=Aurantimonas sp. Leaf443 TaxID=1736378 RepID=UPI0006FA5757|nr:AsmA-like C-terminal region-containing protein [Aurantimonas sp. Leaf443]KQT87934.1 hypothetical protein ASG48_00235 [Aurantimonas sp. Leaf443]